MIQKFDEFVNELYSTINSLYKLKLHLAKFEYDEKSSKEFKGNKFIYVPKNKKYDNYRIFVTYSNDDKIMLEIVDEDDSNYTIFKKYYTDKKLFAQDFLEITDIYPD